MSFSFPPNSQKKLFSATPTPLDSQWEVDKAALASLLRYQLTIGIEGFFVGGTCGEGPWLSNTQRQNLIRTAREAVGPEVPILAPATDNSAPRIRENIRLAKDEGADMAVIAEINFHPNASDENVFAIYEEAISGSELPVCLYCRGSHANIQMTDDVFSRLLRIPQVAVVKDSSAQESKRRVVLEAKRQRPELFAFCGDETRCNEYLRAGYDGLLLGGAVFNAPLVLELFSVQDFQTEALDFDEQIRKLNLRVYGAGHRWWMGGLKYYLYRKGYAATLNHHLRFAVPQALKDDIDALVASEN